MREIDIEIKRMLAAKHCNLILNDNGDKYLKHIPSDISCPRRHYCNKVDFKPDLDWNQFMFFASSCEKIKNMVVVPNITPKEMFEVAINRINR